ncbi:tafazzin [Sodiomyces alkalinus F11]|uniref:Tafazzin family protein n=1 Tax=Sodiomyces alkalinus (strain CBS 110278 / VKM F-3762 / F11) TaxID=1314773 RepID=A0A3N2PWG4_SODAK|nr:tafazzin [Sodiomyces alkalinus F11]ROT38850.1 tafazzin [Sodiomyces alkalinus F11]
MPCSELWPARRSLAWRLGSAGVMGLTGTISRALLYGLNTVQTQNLVSFLKLLDQRRSGGSRQGLLTVSNHISVLDDPLMWGVLPLKYAFDPANLRWGLGAHDICFKKKFTSSFFTLGQVLPTYRLFHSPHGGLFQPTMAESIRLLSGEEPSPPSEPNGLTFATDAGDVYPSPSGFRLRNAWIHVFPEACVHQHPMLVLRYFKWGVSRLILESNPAPLLVPMFIDGIQHIMHEHRRSPRWLPRIGQKVHVVFGDALDTGHVFGRQRAIWRRLIEEQAGQARPLVDHSYPEQLKYGSEAIQLRIEVAETVRSAVAGLRGASGYPPDDPTFALARTWQREPPQRRFKSPVDGSIVHKE